MFFGWLTLQGNPSPRKVEQMGGIHWATELIWSHVGGHSPLQCPSKFPPSNFTQSRSARCVWLAVYASRSNTQTPREAATKQCQKICASRFHTPHPSAAAARMRCASMRIAFSIRTSSTCHPLVPPKKARSSARAHVTTGSLSSWWFGALGFRTRDSNPNPPIQSDHPDGLP